MARIKEEQKEAYQFPKYSKEELRELDTLLKEKYNGGLKGIDINHWLVDEGGLNKYGAVIYESYPPKYEILMDKLNQMDGMNGRKEYAIKMENEKLVEQMTDF